MGLLRVRHDWATSLSLFTFMHWRRKWQPTPVFLLGESQGRGAWRAAVCGVIQSRTRLKRLSSSSILLNLWQLQVQMSIPSATAGLSKPVRAPLSGAQFRQLHSRYSALSSAIYSLSLLQSQQTCHPAVGFFQLHNEHFPCCPCCLPDALNSYMTSRLGPHRTRPPPSVTLGVWVFPSQHQDWGKVTVRTASHPVLLLHRGLWAHAF